MLSPNDIGRKAATPSIWSYDSGYGSTSVCEEQGGLLQLTQPQAGPPISAHVLPKTSPEIDTCIECDFWPSADADLKCQKCRLPEIVEPQSVSGAAWKGKTLLRLNIPLQVQRARADVPEISLGRAPEHHQSSKIGAASRCSACELSALINPSTAKFCQSCSFIPTYLSPVSEGSPKYEVRRSRAGRNSKLPLRALNRLQAWLDANQHDPYPTAETKRALAEECGITEKQVTTWFTNARARQLSPIDTYLSSSSDEEGARQSDIEDAAESSIQAAGFSYIPGSRPHSHDRRAASVSDTNIFSNPQSHARPSRRGKKKDYRRNANPETPQTPLHISSPRNASPQDDPDMWQCTFCRKSLVPKSWRRHEETQHRPKAQWTCMLYGPRLSFPARSNSSSVCAFCMMKNPSEDHFLSHHRIEDCARRDVADRTFFRPDHLRQHVKNFHNATLYDTVQARWKKTAETVPEGWNCGFCSERLETWDKRETHIANHFKDGMTMASWTDYPDNSPKEDKEGKSADKGKGKSRSSGLDYLSEHTFSRHPTRSPQIEMHQQPFVPQPVVQTTQSPFSNTWDPIPSSLSLGISQPQPPILPAIPLLDPLIDCGDFGGWTFPASTGPEMQYTMTDSKMFHPSTTSLAQQFDNMLGFDFYGGQLGYQQDAWGQMGPPQQQHDPSSPYSPHDHHTHHGHHHEQHQHQQHPPQSHHHHQQQ